MVHYIFWCIILGFTGHVLLTDPNETDLFFASLLFGLSLLGITIENVIRLKNGR